jgi:hypothetical protein
MGDDITFKDFIGVPEVKEKTEEPKEAENK